MRWEQPTDEIPIHEITGDQLLPSITMPHDLPGFTWVELGLEHSGAVGKLIDRIESYDDPPFRTSAAEVRDFYLSPQQWRSVGAVNEEGSLVAYAQVRLRSLRNEVLCNGGVDPHYRGKGLGQACLLWERAQAKQMLDRSCPGEITFYVEQERHDLADILVHLGYRQVARYDDYRRDLTQPFTTVTVTFPLEIRQWRPEYDELVWQAANRLLDFVGAERITYAEWQRAHKNFHPHCSFIALDKSTDRWEVAAFALCSIYRQDWASVGERQGYLDFLGVLPDWQHSVVPQALLSEVFQALKAEGLTSLGASLPAGGEEQLQAVFTDCGLVPTTSTTQYSIELAPLLP